MSAGAAAGAAAAAAAAAAAQGYQLLVGGLLLAVPPEAFLDLQRRTGGLVLTGCTVTFWKRRPKRRFYFLPHQGLTFYCRLPAEETLSVPGAVEVAQLQLGPLATFLDA